MSDKNVEKTDLLEFNISKITEAIEGTIPDITKKEYNKLKASLQELERRKKSKIPYLIAAILGLCVSLSCYRYFDFSRPYEKIYIIVIASVVIGSMFAFMFYSYYRLILDIRESSMRRKIYEYEALHIKEDVKEDVFENSIKMSYKYLDQYYLQTREQAQRGFFVTVSVAVFGALLIGGGIIAMFAGCTSPAYITCASGVITEFIAAVFFYLYNKTISSMSNYHNKLVLSQNISIALKVADSLPTEDKVKAKNKIVEELLKDINTHLIKSDAVDSKQ